VDGLQAPPKRGQLPEQLKGTLPTIEEIEAELGKSGEQDIADGEKTIP
jgi:hypothetical protein